jgi:hypothetical protein
MRADRVGGKPAGAMKATAPTEGSFC